VNANVIQSKTHSFIFINDLYTELPFSSKASSPTQATQAGLLFPPHELTRGSQSWHALAACWPMSHALPRLLFPFTIPSLALAVTLWAHFDSERKYSCMWD